MAQKPIIEIDVRDAAFDAFFDKFEKFRTHLEDIPDAWKKLGDAMEGSGKAVGAGALDAKDALAVAAAQAGVIAEALSEAVKQQSSLGRETSKSEKGFASLTKTAKGLGKEIVSIGLNILKFSAVGLGLSALGGGLGFADLASQALSRQRTSNRLGLSPGQLASFQVNAQPFLETSALANAVAAQSDVRSAGQLAALGIDFQHAQKEQTSDLAFEMLKQARTAWIQAQQSGLSPMQSPAVMAYQALGGDIGDVRQAAMASLTEINKAQADVKRDAASLDYSRKVGAAWIEFEKALDRAGFLINTDFINALTGLAPELTKLSTEVVGAISAFLKGDELGKVIDDVRDALHGLNDFLTETNWKDVGADVGQFGKDVVDAIGFVENLLHPGRAEAQAKKKADAEHEHGVRFSTSGAAGVVNTFLDRVFGAPGAKKSIAAITQVASALGIDPDLAISTAMRESTLNARRTGDPNKQGRDTSFGLFQLHEGGELGSLTPDQAFDPTTNARTALSEFARVQKAHAGLDLSPGTIAALAQRPADPLGYSQDVDAIYEQRTGKRRSAEQTRREHIAAELEFDMQAHGRNWRRYLPEDIRTDVQRVAPANALGNDATIRAIVKALTAAKKAQPKIMVSVYNSTAARVAVSANAVSA